MKHTYEDMKQYMDRELSKKLYIYVAYMLYIRPDRQL